MSPQSHDLPPISLLQRYVADGAYTDCYATEAPGRVGLADFVEAFYTTRLFKLERLILRVAAQKPSTDADARQLAQGAAGTFAAWRVEDRDASQLLLGDFTGRTKSWLMVEPSPAGTRLYFGSAVLPVMDRQTGERRMGAMFRALLGFHRLYSRLLLAAARRKLLSARPA